MTRDYLELIEYLDSVSYRVVDKITGTIIYRVSPLPVDRIKNDE